VQQLSKQLCLLLTNYCIITVHKKLRMRKYLRLLLSGVFLFFNFSLLAQQKTVTGVVIGDDDNAPLRDVTVTVKGTNTRTKTNEAGRFTITASPGQELVFTFVDYTRQEVPVGAGNTYNVRMVQAQKQLGEVVVTGYGARKSKREMGYQVQDVKGEDIASTQRENFINSLAGRVAGATVTQSAGAPGASSQIILRGATSIGGNNQPLFVVDGVPYDNQTFNQENLAAGSIGFANRNSDYGNRAGDINPDDIESVTILKGPEATALYGSDGASGAIIITTRKGRAGKGSVTYDNSFRFEEVYRFPEVQRVYARGNNGVTNPAATVNPYSIGEQFSYFGGKYKEGTQFYDNIDAFFKTGFTQKHNVNVEGGSETSTYRLSANYTDQSGIIPNSAFERLSLRLGGTAKLSPKFNVSTSANYVTSVTDKVTKGAGSYLMNLLNFPQDVDVRDYQNPDGSRKLIRGTSLTTEFDNPLWDVNKNRGQDKVDRITTNVTLNYDPFKWLNLGVITGLDVYSQTGDLIVHPQSRSAFTAGGFLSLYTQNTKNWSNVLKGTFRKKFGKFSNTLTVGFANDDNRTRIESQKGERFYEQEFKSINNTDPLSRDARTTVLNTRKTRWFGNYVLGFNNIVYASLAGTREGNSTLQSRFIEKDPHYNFGSASLSAVFSDLKIFDKADKWFSYGKARLSYGETGKGPSSPYIIDYTFTTQSSTGGGYAYGVTGNNFFLRPERTKNLEYGVEMRFLNNRLGIDFTRYELKSEDQILAARSSYGTGFVIKYFNGGIVQNKGIEIILTGNPVKSTNFNWDITANFDLNRGKILEMPKDLPTYYDSDTWVFGNLRSQAYKNAFTGNLSGFFPGRNAKGEVVVSAITGLPTRSDDFGVVGDRQPDFKVGLINNLSYKNISLSFNLDFRKGGDVWNGNEYFLFLTGGSTKTLNREQPVVISGVLNDGLQNTSNPTRNAITIIPLYRSEYYNTSNATEADFIEEVNWMRLRDATLTYKLSKKLLSRQKFLKNASVFVTGTDLFMITNYSGADPSVNANTAANRGYGGAGIDFGSISTPRAVAFGIRAQF
jgi:ferric enterobactin receptor